MKLGLKIDDIFYINKNQVVCIEIWEGKEVGLSIFLANREEYQVIPTDPKVVSVGTQRYVSVNEYHRIVREIKEYFGIDEDKK